MPLFLLLLLVLVDEDAWTLRRVEGREALAAGAAVRIENPHGTVRTRPGNEGEVVMLANVQEHAGAAEARVRTETTSAGFRLWVELEGAKTPHPQVDVSLRIPPGARLDISTADGLIEAKGHSGAIELHSTSGEIRLATGGPFAVTTDSGRAAVVLDEIDAATPSRIETRSGEIVLWLPPAPDVLVRASTRGDVTADDSIEIERAGEGGLERAQARIGDATSEITLSSESGPIKILYSLPQERRSP